jgi:hypothetical protein
MESGNVWDEVTFGGRPIRATDTEPEKPFSAVTETVTGVVVVPTTAPTADVET